MILELRLIISLPRHLFRIHANGKKSIDNYKFWWKVRKRSIMKQCLRTPYIVSPIRADRIIRYIFTSFLALVKIRRYFNCRHDISVCERTFKKMRYDYTWKWKKAFKRISCCIARQRNTDERTEWEIVTLLFTFVRRRFGHYIVANPLPRWNNRTKFIPFHDNFLRYCTCI